MSFAQFEAEWRSVPLERMRSSCGICIGKLLVEGEIAVKVLKSKDKWFGVTYKEDKESVVQELKVLIRTDAYPDILFEVK